VPVTTTIPAMCHRRVVRRSLVFLAIPAILACLLSAAACGSSSNTVTAPAAISKCAVTVDAANTTIPAGGGSGTVNVQTERECQWTAQPDVTWLSITSGASGQGPGTIQFTATANGDPSARTGDLMVNGQKAQVAQAAGECHFDLSSAATALGQAGGTGTVDVRASSALCTWTAVSDANWISITSSGNGKGSSTVAFTVQPTTGPPRAGTLTIAGLHFSVTQAEGCTYAVAPITSTVGAGGGTQTVSITAASGCPWMAVSNVSWITVSATNGTGSGSVVITVAPMNGPSRTGTVTIAGQIVTVTQGEGCTFAISPDLQSVPSSGGSGSVTVTAGSGCGWSASSNQPWITISSGGSGTGNGTVNFSVASTTGPGRSGTLTIAGSTFTINQGQGCALSLSSASASAPAGGASGSFDVSTADGCAWAANSSASWLTISAGATGSGNGTVRYSAAANPGPQRTATITAGWQTFTVTQSGSCTFSISPQQQNVSSAGGSASVAVTGPAGCSWTASSNASWISVSSGGSGSGNGTVQLAVSANADADRHGTATIAGQTFTIDQSSGCSVSLSPNNQNLPAGGGTGSFVVTTNLSCTWTATANAPWLSVTSGQNGNGPGTVRFSADANKGAARTGTITVGGQSFTVTEGSGCSATVTPDTITEDKSGGSHNVAITTSADCTWTATSNAPWITLGNPTTGSGNGTAHLDVGANTGPARTGTATVAGDTVTVNQASGCTIAISPKSQTIPAAGGTGTVTVTAGAGCTWTAVSKDSWIHVTAGASGSGNGAVTFGVDANTGKSRNGSIDIGGQTFTINQSGS